MVRKQVRILLVFILFSVMLEGLNAQPDSTILPKNYISTNVLKPLFRRFTLRYERMITENDALRFEAEYKYPSSANSYKNVIVFPIENQDGKKLKIHNRGSITTSYSISIGYARYFFPETILFYFGGDGFYRYSFYEYKYYHNCANGSSDYGSYLESRYSHDFGVKPQVGIKVPLTKESPVQILFDFYIGPILYLRLEKEILYGYEPTSCSTESIDLYDSPIESLKLKPQFAILLGINFTVAF